MADWTDPPYPQLVAGKPWTDEKASAAFENVVALSECADGSPYMQTAWHPYDGFAIGDGITGRIWSQAIDGGVATITTPDFVDGYEYRLRFDGVTVQGLNISVYRETSAAYATIVAMSGVVTTIDGWLDVLRPRIVSNFCRAIGWYRSDVTTNDQVADTTTNAWGANWNHATPQKVLNVRLQANTGNFTAGAVYMDKRRVYA